jgi:hypothetical protein
MSKKKNKKKDQTQNDGFWSKEERTLTLSALAKEREARELWTKAAEARMKAIRKQHGKLD